MRVRNMSVASIAAHDTTLAHPTGDRQAIGRSPYFSATESSILGPEGTPAGRPYRRMRVATNRTLRYALRATRMLVHDADATLGYGGAQSSPPWSPSGSSCRKL